jgi:quercetin dioxygenase-like cupin family protein
MALITLSPGEVFAHRHDDDSTSTLLAGSARLEYGSVVTELTTGVPMVTAACVLHRLVATGQDGATVECLHDEPD